MSRAQAAFAAILSVVACASHADLWLTGGTVYVSPDAPARVADVLVRGDKIVSVSAPSQRPPEGATVLDCRGLVVVAGFQNSHVHFMAGALTPAATAPAARLATELSAMLTRFGFTTVVDTGSVLANTTALRARIEAGELAGPRILTAGSPLYPQDGIPIYLRDLPADLLAQLPQPATADAARAIVRANHDAGANVTKLFAGSVMGGGVVKPMSRDIAKAAAEESHRLGMRVFAHPTSMAGANVAIDAGVDVLAHTNSDGWEPSLIERLIANDVALVPTLKLWLYEAARQNMPEDKAQAFVQIGIDELSAFATAGGRVLFGTDVGYMTDYDPSDEYRLMARAKLGSSAILASLTTNPAAELGEADRRGKVAEGQAADLVALGADPATNVAAFTDVRYTIRAGRVIYSKRAEGSATPPPAP